MFKILIETVNDAFVDAPELEVARIVRAAAARIEEGYGFDEPRPLYDLNGNRVGTYGVMG